VRSQAHRQTLGPLTHEKLWPYRKFLRAVTRSSFTSLPCDSKCCLLSRLPAEIQGTFRMVLRAGKVGKNHHALAVFTLYMLRWPEAK
jgi:hypothetical protein